MNGKTPIDWVEAIQFDAQFAFSRAAAHELARNAMSLPNTPEFQFLADLPYMIVGGLNAKNIDITEKNIDLAFNELFDPTSIGQLLKPKEFGQIADQSPPAYLIGNEPLFSSEGNVPKKLYNRALLINTIKSAAASGIRANTNDATADKPNSLVIFETQRQIAKALGDIIENTHLGALSNPYAPVWKGDTVTHMTYDLRDALAKKTKIMGLALFNEAPEEPKP